MKYPDFRCYNNRGLFIKVPCLSDTYHIESKITLLVIFCLTVGACTDIMTSDHSPLFASFQVGGVKQYAPEPGNKAVIIMYY